MEVALVKVTWLISSAASTPGSAQSMCAEHMKGAVNLKDL